MKRILLVIGLISLVTACGGQNLAKKGEPPPPPTPTVTQPQVTMKAAYLNVTLNIDMMAPKDNAWVKSQFRVFNIKDPATFKEPSKDGENLKDEEISADNKPAALKLTVSPKEGEGENVMFKPVERPVKPNQAPADLGARFSVDVQKLSAIKVKVEAENLLLDGDIPEQDLPGPALMFQREKPDDPASSKILRKDVEIDMSKDFSFEIQRKEGKGGCSLGILKPEAKVEPKAAADAAKTTEAPKQGEAAKTDDKAKENAAAPKPSEETALIKDIEAGKVVVIKTEELQKVKADVKEATQIVLTCNRADPATAASVKLEGGKVPLYIQVVTRTWMHLTVVDTGTTAAPPSPPAPAPAPAPAPGGGTAGGSGGTGGTTASTGTPPTSPPTSPPAPPPDSTSTQTSLGGRVPGINPPLPNPDVSGTLADAVKRHPVSRRERQAAAAAAATARVDTTPAPPDSTSASPDSTSASPDSTTAAADSVFPFSTAAPADAL